jgi:ABC-type antimicrobial peptide transport system permease subunit
MNLKQSFHIIFRNRTFSLLNISGLAFGIATTALLLLWVEDELNYNRNLPKSDQLFDVRQIQHYENGTQCFSAISNPIAEALKNNYPEIKNVTRYFFTQAIFSAIDDVHSFNEAGRFVDPDIFDMLDIHLIQGDPSNAFKSPDAIVISKEMAQKVFGNVDPVGKSLMMDKTDVYQVTGVFKELPANSSFQFQWLIPFASLLIKKPYLVDSGNNIMQCYVELGSSADMDAVNRKLLTYFSDRGDKEEKTNLILFPINRMHLYSEFKDGQFTGSGEIRKVRLFGFIAAIIILIACINYINLSTARSQRRMMEAGLRKTFGARRRELIAQFIGESAVITFIALVIAVFLIRFSLPFFNNLIQKNLALQLFKPVHLFSLLGIWILCSLLAGSYPAFYLSSSKPVITLKGMKAQTGAVVWVRKGLVIFQFAISYILIFATVVVYLQILHVQNRSLGYNREGVIRIDADKPIKESFDALHAELQNTGVVVNSALSDQQMINIGANGWGYQWTGIDPNVKTLVWQLFSSEGFIETLQMNLINGRDFHTGSNVDYGCVIINRRLADMMGEEGKVGGWLGRSSWEQPKEVIGIVDNLVFGNMYSATPQPMVISKALSGDSYGSANYLFIRIKPKADIQAGLNKIEETLKRFSAGQEFAFVFMDEDFDRMIKSEKLTGTLASLFAALAIIISCLGIFGLSAFSAEQRTKEVGIRKVLGATEWSIVRLLGDSFMRLITLSLVIAVPIAWYEAHLWLQNYEYRISLGWYIFVATGLLVALIAMLTVSAQSMRAAMTNPIKAIKTE